MWARKSDVHPTAYVSASILGRNVQVGAHATIRNSIIGDGAVIQDHAVLLNCVVGANTLITENAFLVSDVIYPDATVGNYKLQVCLIGRGAYVNNWASFVDAKFVGHVKVQQNGALVSSERAFLGSVVGHRAKMAAKVIVQAGREIPNDTVVVMRPDEVIRTVPKGLPPGQPLVRDRGTLVPPGAGVEVISTLALALAVAAAPPPSTKRVYTSIDTSDLRHPREGPPEARRRAGGHAEARGPARWRPRRCTAGARRSTTTSSSCSHTS